MEINQKLKNIALIIVVLVILSAIAALVASKVMKPGTDKTDTKPLEVSKTSVPTDKIPGSLPADLPIEKNAKVLQNFSATVSNGANQSTRSYETQKSLAENLKIYSDFLKSKGWDITATVDKQSYKMVAARKGNDSMQVEMNTDPESKALTVTISLTEFPN
jgi:hypothetical protein